MFGECHAHVIMDGMNYRKAVDLHRDGVKDEVIRAHFEAYKKRGVTFVRDGGDALGVSKRAKELAAEYGIDYRSPIFAIHKEGHYGGIVGRGFRDLRDFHKRVLEAKAEGADFIKIMTTGLMDFKNHGQVTGTPLEAGEVKEMVHIAHEEGFAVMSHTNGIYGVQAAVEAGVDSVEHGNFIDEETIQILSQSRTVWVPTLVTVRNLLGCGRYSDEVIRPIMEIGERNLSLAYAKKARVALGSDAGAYMVPHGKGIEDEYDSFRQILGNSPGVQRWLEDGEWEIKERFRRQ
ncbi:MAG: amidohydrolase family protein [Eubacteriales bacterium]|nr:amidohydrolase family protein [Eubacteriales bacterium]